MSGISETLWSVNANPVLIIMPWPTATEMHQIQSALQKWFTFISWSL